MSEQQESEIISTLTLPKTLYNHAILIPKKGNKTRCEGQLDTQNENLISNQEYVIEIYRGNTSECSINDNYWDLNLMYKNQDDSVIFRIDYGHDLEGHHFTTAHIHIGPDSWNIAYELTSDKIHEYPFSYVYIPESIDTSNDHDIINAIEGFLYTCGFYEAGQLEYVFDDEDEDENWGTQW